MYTTAATTAIENLTTKKIESYQAWPTMGVRHSLQMRRNYEFDAYDDGIIAMVCQKSHTNERRGEMPTGMEISTRNRGKIVPCHFLRD